MFKKLSIIMVSIVVILILTIIPTKADTVISDNSESIWNVNSATIFHDSGVEWNLGTVFEPTSHGKITHIRVFGVIGESGDHIAYIWKNNSNKILGGPYILNYKGTNDWVLFDIPDIRVEPGVNYTVTVSTGTDDNRYYPVISDAITTTSSNGKNLNYPQNAGVYSTIINIRPTESYNGNNYLRDIVFVPDKIIESSIYRARQVDKRVYIERSIEAGFNDFDKDKDGWALVGRTNGAGENGTLVDFFVYDGTPYAIVKAYTHQLKDHYRIVTPPRLDIVKKGQTRITPVVARITTDEKPMIEIDGYRAIQVGERVHIERSVSLVYDDFDANGDGWALLGRTNGAGENGKLVGFFIRNNQPYAVVKSYTVQLGWHYRLITPPSMEIVRVGQTRITPVIDRWIIN